MRYFRNARDPISSYTHFLGAAGSLIAVFLMLLFAVWSKAPWMTYVSVLLFGASLIALYSASTYYHYIPAASSSLTLFRKVDHAMIYVLIAGSYTPILSTFMPAPRSIWFLVVIWSIAIIGIVTKLLWLNAPRFLYTLFYIAMGWAIVVDWSFFAHAPTGLIILLGAGGLSYTIGAVFYILKKPNFSPDFGFHELFHCFILGGSFFHILAVLLFVCR